MSRAIDYDGWGTMIKTWNIKGKIHIQLDEPLNAKNQVAFLKAVETHPQGEQVSLHMDLVPYIDSSGLASLLQLRDHAHGFHNVILCNPSERVLHTLRVSNFHRLYTIQQSPKTAQSTATAASVQPMLNGGHNAL
ncbi:anti-sigma-factor antagonist [Magnetococcus marinus MC-1]|uniref:Anti-sigma-factor antagonist n=1 Tax=Magnetococcus marinus (strain ATCC BAA-1437 / JCM 17883 / MC-1) TaxID=156889 RepID=A0L3Y6_MAGMM|nr:STAS domain-containing protein [Magnetococcus marinus]ABK42679.1 anti-sigma-factor antagonist [Magnetococcus marinus MC-1]